MGVCVTVKRGATWRLTFRFPADLTGCHARLQVRDKDDRLLIDSSEELGYLTVDGPGKAVVSEVPETVMAGVALGLHVSDLRLVDSLGKVRYTRTFNVLVERQVTHGV